MSNAWPTGFHAWTAPAGFASGTAASTVLTTSGRLTLPANVTDGSWTSPWHEPADTFTTLVPSWQADTPGTSWIGLELQVRTPTAQSQWFDMCSWALETTTIHRRTVKDQADDLGKIVTDAFEAAVDPPGGAPTGYRLRVTLHTQDTPPVVRQIAAATARPGSLPATSSPLSGEQVELNVPRLSQSIHRGEYPDFGGGGQVWCSPVSMSMVLAYWDVRPDASDLAALPADQAFDRNGRVDAVVPWSAMRVWDYDYAGAGNWAFNTAYASACGLDGSVRYCSSLRDVEWWIRHGVPVVVSIAWDNDADDQRGHLDGSSIASTKGHLIVVTGFTTGGDVIANDPASPSNDAVRHVYRRDQFERNWLRASGGATYVIQAAPLGPAATLHRRAVELGTPRV
jgi:hypothetical protein